MDDDLPCAVSQWRGFVSAVLGRTARPEGLRQLRRRCPLLHEITRNARGVETVCRPVRKRLRRFRQDAGGADPGRAGPGCLCAMAAAGAGGKQRACSTRGGWRRLTELIGLCGVPAARGSRTTAKNAARPVPRLALHRACSHFTAMRRSEASAFASAAIAAIGRHAKSNDSALIA